MAGYRPHQLDSYTYNPDPSIGVSISVPIVSALAPPPK